MSKRLKEAKNINDRPDLNVVVVLNDEQTWTGLGSCSLVIVNHKVDLMDEGVAKWPLQMKFPDDPESLEGVYALDELIKKLPLQELRKFKVDNRRPPKPKGVKRHE